MKTMWPGLDSAVERRLRFFGIDPVRASAQADLRQNRKEVEGGGSEHCDASPVHPPLPDRWDRIPVGGFDESAEPPEKIRSGKGMICRYGSLPVFYKRRRFGCHGTPLSAAKDDRC